ncbi:MAG: hypothetical protein RI900_2376 [Actinomycetota bacterium]
MTTMNHLPTNPTQIDRRALLRIGGVTVAGAAFVAACGSTAGGEIGRVGTGATKPTLLDPVVDDGVLLRSSASIETSIANAYQRILDSGVLAGGSATYADLGDQSDLVAKLQEHHTAAAATFNELAVAAGAEAWECGNTRLDAAYIDPVFNRVQDGAAATDAAAAIEPSDDACRDMINLVLALENLSAETCQAMVPLVTQAAQRVELMTAGARSARQAALVALAINPGAHVAGSPAAQAAPTTTAPAGDEPPQTEIPLPIAINSQFGSLAPVTWIGGKGDENGVRLKVNFETPSLNSLAYPFDTCA